MSARQLAGVMLFELPVNVQRELACAGELACPHCKLANAFAGLAVVHLKLDLNARVDGHGCAQLELMQQCPRCRCLGRKVWIGNPRRIFAKFRRLSDGARFDSTRLAQKPQPVRRREARPHAKGVRDAAVPAMHTIRFKVRPSVRNPGLPEMSDSEVRTALCRVRRAHTWQALLNALGIRNTT